MAEEERKPELPLRVTDPIAFAEVLVDHKELKKFYAARNVHCFACMATELETFEQGAKVHAGGPHGAFDAEKLVAELNELARQHPYREETRYNDSLVARIVGWLFPTDAS